MTPAEILDALGQAAALEHAHCVYFLRLHYALGGDPMKRDDDAPPGVREAAEAAFGIAQGAMFHLKHVNRILVAGGREPVLDRVEEVAGHDLHPMTPVQFTRFPERELALARALDGAYAHMRAGLGTPAPPFTGPLLDDLTNLLDAGANHAGDVPPLADNLAMLTPAQYLLVTGEAPASELDRRLMALSDRIYGALVDVLRLHFADTEGFGGFRQQAMDRMDDLHAVNEILVLQRLLPAFAF